MMDLQCLVKECHRRSQANGWWTENPNLPEKIALIHSEISEADEGQLEGGQDKHLPQYPAVEVEIADAAIRTSDLAGFLGMELEFVWISVPKNKPILDVLPRLANIFMSRALEGLRKGDLEKARVGLCEAMSVFKVWADELGMDFFGVIVAKLDYNDHRPDHKPENRAKAGGKAF